MPAPVEAGGHDAPLRMLLKMLDHDFSKMGLVISKGQGMSILNNLLGGYVLVRRL